MPSARFMDELDGGTHDALLSAGIQITVDEGSFLMHDADDASSVFYVLDGLLKVVKTSLDGDVSFVGLRRSGTLVGELGVLTGRPRASSVQAARPSHVVRIANDRFENLLVSHPELTRALLGELAHRLQEATLHIHDLMNADAKTRMATRLIQLADDTVDRPGDALTLVLPVTQEELGDWAGLSRAGAVKALRVLRDDDLIETSRMSIAISDLPRLRTIATV